MRYILILLLALSSINCRTIGKHWLKNAETGELELVEQIEMRGTAKHEIEFATEGKVKADSGLELKIPDIELDIEKLKN